MKSRKVSISDVISASRFDGRFHNADVNIYDNILRHHSSHPLSYYCEEIFTASRGRRAYTSSAYGVPYLSNSDVISSDPFTSCHFMSKKYGYEERAVLRGGMILTGRVGAIGQIAYVPSYWEALSAMGSDNIYRIKIKPQYHNGYIYAFLASKVGNMSFWKLATGGVQPYVTDSMIATIPIPDCDSSVVSQSDSLIKEAANLREEASTAKAKALQLLSDFINVSYTKKGFGCGKVNSKEIVSSLQLRIDPPALMNAGVETMKCVRSLFKTKAIGEIDAKVFRPGIFKRNKVASGYPYIKGSEIFDSNPFRNCEYLSRSRTPFVDEMKLHEGQILITCAGSVGDIKIITREYDEKDAIGSQDIIRLESNDSLFTKEYMYVYLQMPFVHDYIQSMKYGSVIERIEPFHVESIPVVVPTPEIADAITTLVRAYMDCIYRAFKCEEEAVCLVENEIESWSSK